MDENIVVTFTTNLGDFLSLQVLKFAHPKNTDFLDGNWVTTTVNVRVGNFKAEVTADLRLDELADFHQQLSDLNSRKINMAEFKTIEGWLEIEVTLSNGGRGAITGMAKDSFALTNENSLRFMLEADKLNLSNPIRQLAITLDTFPIRGLDS
jgi:hypothetical protein